MANGLVLYVWQVPPKAALIDPDTPVSCPQTPPHMNKTKQVGVFRNKTTQGTPLGIYIGLNAPPFGLILVGGTSGKNNNNFFWGAPNYFLVLHTQNEAQNKNAHWGG